MPVRRSVEATPDLFSAAPTANTAVPPTAPGVKAQADKLALQPRHFLPKDLAGALSRLDDTDIDALWAAVTVEAERRGRLPPSLAKRKSAADAKPEPRPEPVADLTASLTTGKANAVRAAFKAGVKPSVIARQFGISRSDVSKVLASGRRDRKSGR